MGMGKCNSKMGIAAQKQNALLMVGASGGIGAALLEYLSTRTDLVCLPTYNKKKPLIDNYSWHQYNSNIYDSTRTMFETISQKYELAVVVDVSGAFFASKLENTSAEELSQVISTNLIAPLILAKYAQEFMGEGGRIIFMSSIVSTMQIVGSSAYAASKAGLEGGISALSSEFEQTGHAICGIRLGYMDYGMTYKIKEKVRQEILLRLPQEQFINIQVLGDKILNLIRSAPAEINGMLYEIK
jgi:NAD(P)-dependent dehydrogenase (short-subunit alcohol dehydrogenase family)